MIIDWHRHFDAEELFRKRGKKSGQAEVRDGKVAGHLHEESYRIDKQLESMDAAGIDVAVLSTAAHAVEDCRIIDDCYLNVMKEYTKRFVGFATCIPTGGKQALKELERAINSGLKGSRYQSAKQWSSTGFPGTVALL